MYISEVYPCLQGEGRLMGVPSILIRTSLCNLRCQFAGGNLCDTSWTSWKPELDNQMTPDQLVAEVDKQAGSTIKHVIISGGEPTIQKEFPELLGKLSLKYHVTVESNGTTVVDLAEVSRWRTEQVRPHPTNILFSVSPKLASSTPRGTVFEQMHEKRRLNYTSLTSLYQNYDTYLKFVMCSSEDLEEIQEVQRQLQLPNDHIYLMPEGITQEEILAKSGWLSDLCTKTGYRFSSRLHVLAYGNKRRT